MFQRPAAKSEPPAEPVAEQVQTEECPPDQTGVTSMADELERTVEFEVIIKTDGAESSKKFLLYQGTQMVYAQGVDLAVTEALGTISKVAFDLITGGGDDIPEIMAIEAAFGRGVHTAQGG